MILFVVLQRPGVLLIIIVHLLTPEVPQLSYLLWIILGHVAAYQYSVRRSIRDNKASELVIESGAFGPSSKIKSLWVVCLQCHIISLYRLAVPLSRVPFQCHLLPTNIYDRYDHTRLCAYIRNCLHTQVHTCLQMFLCTYFDAYDVSNAWISIYSPYLLPFHLPTLSHFSLSPRA